LQHAKSSRLYCDISALEHAFFKISKISNNFGVNSDYCLSPVKSVGSNFVIEEPIPDKKTKPQSKAGYALLYSGTISVGKLLIFNSKVNFQKPATSGKVPKLRTHWSSLIGISSSLA